jgi:hypothetical protein
MTAPKKVQYDPTATSGGCRVCGAQLTRRSGPGRPRVVCPGECAAEANHRRASLWRSNGPKERRCEVCTAELPHSRGCSRFCSTSCRRTAVNARRKARRHAAAQMSRNAPKKGRKHATTPI